MLSFRTVSVQTTVNENPHTGRHNGCKTTNVAAVNKESYQFSHRIEQQLCKETPLHLGLIRLQIRLRVGDALLIVGILEERQADDAAKVSLFERLLL